MKAYLGIDIGTTAVKAALFDGQGTMLGGGLAEYTLETVYLETNDEFKIVYSEDGCIYYTDDHYESFTLLYGEE